MCKVFGKICTANLSERSPNHDLSGIGQNHVNGSPTMNMSVNAKGSEQAADATMYRLEAALVVGRFFCCLSIGLSGIGVPQNAIAIKRYHKHLNIISC